jgi:mannose-6-phosphate isomerase
MATSDNVIRAGLTSKLRDVPNLVANLTYNAGDPVHHSVRPESFAPHTALYDPPIPEFAVLEVNLPPGERTVHRALQGPSVAIVTSGKGMAGWAGKTLELKEGEVFFVGAGTETELVATEGDFAVYRAFVELRP